MDSRLKTSGMTEGGIEDVGNDMGGIVWSRMGNALDSASLLACLLWPFCHARWVPSVMPARSPLACPLGPLCHSRRLLAGIQSLSLLSLHLWGPAWEKSWIPD